MHQEPKAALSRTPEASASAKDHLETPNKKAKKPTGGSTLYSLLGLITFVYSSATFTRNFVLRLLLAHFY